MKCVMARCEMPATHRVRMLPEGGRSRQSGVAMTCAGHVETIRGLAPQLMGAVQASREALVADSYRVEVSLLGPGVAEAG